jgi:large subunit ribosomal protein L23
MDEKINKETQEKKEGILNVAKKVVSHVKPTKQIKNRPLLVDPWSIVVAPLLTEKAIGMIEREGKLVFIVNRKSNKRQIKWAIEKIIETKINKVQTLIDRKGRKKAFVALDEKNKAIDIATRFGML